jgi:hypothetical protein
MPVDFSGSIKNVSDIAAACGEYPQNSSASSTEQLYCPVLIRKSADGSNELIPGFEQPSSDGSSGGSFSGGHIGPTRSELDPYFSNILGDPGDWINENDFQMALNNGQGPNGPDVNIRKVNRSTISIVSVNHHRGPMILSGWGFDHADRAAPSTSDDVFSFDPEVVNNRQTWKAGPIDLKWDAVRKVWGTGHHIVCGVASSSISAPSNPCSPTFFTIKVFRNSDSNPIPVSLSNCELRETLTVTNRDPSLSQELVAGKVFVIAGRINYEYIPLWVGCPEPNEDTSEPPPSCVC